jgi:hypothetical protein
MTVSYLLSTIVGSCLYSGTVVGTLNAAGTQFVYAAQTVPKAGGGILCPSTDAFIGYVTQAPAQPPTIFL